MFVKCNFTYINKERRGIAFIYRLGGYVDPVSRPSSSEDDPGSIAIKVPVLEVGILCISHVICIDFTMSNEL